MIKNGMGAAVLQIFFQSPTVRNRQNMGNTGFNGFAHITDAVTDKIKILIGMGCPKLP